MNSSHIETLNVTLVSGARSRSIQIVEKALEMGAQPNSADAFGLTALHHAANANDVRMIQVLMRHGASTSETGSVGFSPLCSAAAGGRLDAMKLLAVHSLDLEQLKTGSLGILEMSLIGDKLDVAHWLIDQGADVNAFDWRATSLITRMASAGRYSAIHLLVESGAAVGEQEMAAVLGAPTWVLHSLKKAHVPGAKSPWIRKLHLGHEAELSDDERVEMAWDDELDGNDLDRTKRNGFVPSLALPHAGRLIKEQMDKLSVGFSKSCSLAQLSVTSLSKTPKDFWVRLGLTQSSRNQNKTATFLKLLHQGELVQARGWLVAHHRDIDINATGHKGLHALQLLTIAAGRLCHPHAGPEASKTDSTDSGGMPETLTQSEHQVLELMRWIDRHGPTRRHLFQRFSETGNTFLHELIALGLSDVVRCALSLSFVRSLVNTANHNLARPVHLAVQKPNPRLLAALIAAGANPNAFDRHGHTPLHMAAFMLEHKCAEAAISMGANVHLRTRNGVSLDRILDQRKGQSEVLGSMLKARRAIDSAKSIFSSNNPLAAAVQSRQKPRN